MSGGRAQVMVLGTYHMANPNQDYVMTDYRDVLDEGYQRQIEDVVARLLRFRPTQVAVEVEPGRIQPWQERYEAYRAGRLEPGRNEIEQLGFRLAAGMGHACIHGIDCRIDLDIGGSSPRPAAWP